MKVIIKQKKFDKRCDERRKSNKRKAERADARFWDRKSEVIYG